MKLYTPSRYEGKDFILRLFQIGDAKILYEAVSSSVEHLKPTMPWATKNYSLKDAQDIIQVKKEEAKDGTDFLIGIFSKDEEKVLGGTGFHRLSMRSQVAEMGMWIRQDLANQGLGTRVAKAMTEWGLYEWPWQRLEWRCNANNKSSIMVAKKIGMEQEGCLKSHCLDHNGHRRDTVIFGKYLYHGTDVRGAHVRTLEPCDARDLGKLHSVVWVETYWSIAPSRATLVQLTSISTKDEAEGPSAPHAESSGCECAHSLEA